MGPPADPPTAGADGRHADRNTSMTPARPPVRYIPSDVPPERAPGADPQRLGAAVAVRPRSRPAVRGDRQTLRRPALPRDRRPGSVVAVRIAGADPRFEARSWHEGLRPGP